MSVYRRLTLDEVKLVSKQVLLPGAEPKRMETSPYAHGEEIMTVLVQASWTNQWPWVTLMSLAGVKLGLLKMDPYDYERNDYLYFRSEKHKRVTPMYLYLLAG